MPDRPKDACKPRRIVSIRWIVSGAALAMTAASVLGVGAVVKEPVVIDDAIAIRSMAYLALTFDHRLIDGAMGDQFTLRVKQVLESWSEDIG